MLIYKMKKIFSMIEVFFTLIIQCKKMEIIKVIQPGIKMVSPISFGYKCISGRKIKIILT